MLAAVLAIDCALVARIPHGAALLGPLAPAGIVAFAVFLGLGYPRLKEQAEPLRFNAAFFCAHAACVTAVYVANYAARQEPVLNTPAALLLLSVTLALGVALLALALAPLRQWTAAVRATGFAGVYAAVAGAAAWALRAPMQSLWIRSSSTDVYLMQSAAFRSVKAVLGLLLPNLVVQSGPFILGTPRFTIRIGAVCSGIEGLGLVLVFTTLWLCYFRKESRFPQALLLIPCALACVWALNVVRIAVLILIGNAGFPEVAIVGFHSQAGWIAFTLVALGFSMATRNLPWVRENTACAAAAGPSPEAYEAAESPATAAYLVPFLAILAASFVSKSASGHFEWLYPLRFFAAAGALRVFRKELRILDWRVGWAAPLTGIAIFLLWIAPEWWAHLAAGSGDSAVAAGASALGPALAALPVAARLGCIAFRVAAAIITVPLAEELAFRGYLARRIVARAFDDVPFSRLTVLAIAVSSAAFGMMHGQRWLAGTVAGVAYAFVLRRRGRIGDAVAAHAVTNLLLAAWVLARDDWAQW